MSREELAARMEKYKANPKDWNKKLVITIGDILQVADIPSQDWYAFRKGEITFGPQRWQRIDRAIRLAETGCLSKRDGIIYVGRRKKEMPPNATVFLGPQGAQLKITKDEMRKAGVLPSFNDVFQTPEKFSFIKE
jgi:hypothetical protein